jgi:arginyl-tRNA synthetase
MIMIEDKIKDEISGAVDALFRMRVNPNKVVITRSDNKEHGDYASNVSFRLARDVNQTPVEIAEKIAEYLGNQKVFDKVEAISGFVNVFLDKKHYIETLKDILSLKDKYGQNKMFTGQKVQIEFISANPTGPLTLANGRGGFSGDVLASLFAWSGAKVTREYYVNDGGNQVKILGDSILVSAGIKKAEGDVYKGAYIDDWIKKHPDEIKKYADDTLTLGRLAASDILSTAIKPVVVDMGIKYDNWFSENSLIKSGEVEDALKYFNKSGLTYEKDGALWFRTSKYDDTEDRVLVKTDKEKTYFANDTAYHWDKFAKRKFDKVVNLWGADHHGYVERLQASVAAMGYPGKLDIIIMQMVRLLKGGEEVKMSKRKGTYITMSDLFELIGGAKKEASDVARFFFLSRSHNTHMDFDLDLAKERSDKNPVYYVKYAYARIHGIIAKSPFKGKKDKIDLSLLTDPAELELIDQLAQLPGMIQSILVMKDYPVHLLTFYSIELASKFHSFYDKCRVIDEGNPGLSMARLELVHATQIVLGIVMQKLIGIDAPEVM